MKFIRIYFLVVGIIVWISCTQERFESPQVESTFKILNGGDIGISFNNQLVDTDSQNIVDYLYYYNGSGVAVGDIDNDGYEDILFGSNQGRCRLFSNQGNMKFVDITEQAGIIAENNWTTGVVMDDINNDGFLDIYICKVKKYSTGEHAHNLAYINQKNGTFKEQSKSLGLDFAGFSTQASFFDFDKDGDLDMYLLNHNVHSVRSYGDISKRTEYDTLAGDVLFENRVHQDGKFRDISRQAGIHSSPLGYGLALATADINNDGWTDIYVGNDFHENDYIYINNGNGTFTESVKKLIPHSSQFSMGIDIADMNQDGRVDLFTTDMLPYDEDVLLTSAGEDNDNVKRAKKNLGFELQNARNHFQLANENGTFSDIAYFTRTFASDWSWSVLLQDFTGDGLRDIFISNGIVKRPNNLDYINYLNESRQDSVLKLHNQQLIDKMPSQKLKNILFTQRENLKFSGIEQSLIGTEGFSTGAAYADLDNDGDLDIITNNINENATIYQNQTSSKSNIDFALIDPDRTTKNSKVFAMIGDKVLMGEYHTTRGFLSSSTHLVTLSLGNTIPDSIFVLWPDGSKQKLESIKAGTTVRVTKNTALHMPAAAIAIPQAPITKLPYQHIENDFYDENNEKLIPKRLGFEGPSLLVHDFNADGKQDFFIGSSRGDFAKIYLAHKDGKYQVKENRDFERDAAFEDTDAALIDFDGDGDKDIYVVSGGNDARELSEGLQDRIYLNNGEGDFRRIPISLPFTNGSTISVGDVNNDQFEDLFIGARSIPTSYGLSPYSFLLLNRGGTGVDILIKERFGMITDSECADIDGDNDLDIILCGDWMPITVLENNGSGQFSEKILPSGFGFWTSIAVHDFNGDNKKEIICGNAGINHKWQASTSFPIKMYVGDFDKNGASEPIIFYHYFKRYVPLASMDKLISQIPSLKKKFTSYESFKNVKSIEDLWPDYKNSLVESRVIDELASIMLVSAKDGYTKVQLPLKTQLSDIQDIEIMSSDSVYIINNDLDYISDLGVSVSSTGVVLSHFDLAINQFKSVKPLFLPLGFNSRLIKKLNTKFIIVGNNEYPIFY